MDELPDGSSSGYEGICPKCKMIIKTNIQGNELGTHVCEPKIKLTNEEILDKYPCIEHNNIECVRYYYAIEAMSQAVKQRDGEIEEWIKTRMDLNWKIGLSDLVEFLNQKL
jgi:hypothetical protein